MAAVTVLFLTAILATLHASHGEKAEGTRVTNPIRRLGGSVGAHHAHGISCESWRLAVETNNIRRWKLVPAACEKYVGHYMLAKQYHLDLREVAYQAAVYASTLKLKGDGKDLWVFDVDETSLSLLPYFAENGFGAQELNYTGFREYVELGESPPLVENRRLYYKLIQLGIKPVFITGRDEARRNITEYNLKKAGYHFWEKLIVRQPWQLRLTAMVYKSGERMKLVQQGYRIVGNTGDQWSDLLGAPTGNRTFKVPNPMYYVS